MTPEPTDREPNHFLWATLFIVATLVVGAVLALIGTKGAWVRQAIQEQQAQDSTGRMDPPSRDLPRSKPD